MNLYSKGVFSLQNDAIFVSGFFEFVYYRLSMEVSI